MKSEICTQKADDLNVRIQQLEGEKRDLEERRKRLEIPAIDRQMLSGLLGGFEDVMEEGTDPQKKDLLRRLVKKVLVHDKRTIEIWYALPNQASVRTLGSMAPHSGRVSNSLLPGGSCGGDRPVRFSLEWSAVVLGHSPNVERCIGGADEIHFELC